MKTLYFKLNNETFIPDEILDDVPTSGAFDEYAEWILENYSIDVSLEDTLNFLKKYGAWDLEELQDLDSNIEKLIWLACIDCKQNNTNYFYMGI